MVKSNSNTQTVSNLHSRVCDNNHPRTYRIKITSDFQRGDDKDGIWSPKEKREYIDSLLQNYPTGILTFVKDLTSPSKDIDPWYVLDGGNRLRAIRDYMENKLSNSDDVRFEGLDPRTQARLETLLVPCQFMMIEIDEPCDTIAKMFTKLNTTSKQLSQGELLKAHGWKGDNWVIEMAKCIIGEPWHSEYDFGAYFKENHTESIRDMWIRALGQIRELKRCETLYIIVGYILTAVCADFAIFNFTYDKLVPLLEEVGGTDASPEDLERIHNKFREFLDIMGVVYHNKIFGGLRGGVPGKSKIAPIFYNISSSGDSAIPTDKIVSFYKQCVITPQLKLDLDAILTHGGDSYSTSSKMEKAVEFINRWDD